MIWEVKKVVDDGIELLPFIEDTPLWGAVKPDNSHCKKINRQLGYLYEAIQKRENYYQLNTSTPFGDSDYKQLSGVVQGILIAMECDEIVKNEKIIIYKTNSNKVLMKIDKIKRPNSYYETIKEIKETLHNLGL